MFVIPRSSFLLLGGPCYCYHPSIAIVACVRASIRVRVPRSSQALWRLARSLIEPGLCRYYLTARGCTGPRSSRGTRLYVAWELWHPYRCVDASALARAFPEVGGVDCPRPVWLKCQTSAPPLALNADAALELLLGVLDPGCLWRQMASDDVCRRCGADVCFCHLDDRLSLHGDAWHAAHATMG